MQKIQKVVFPIALAAGFLSLLMLFLTGVLYKGGSVQLGTAFTMLRYCAIAGLVSVGLVIFYLLWQRPKGPRIGLLFVSAVAGLVAFYMPYRTDQVAQSLPFIHDISTDTVNPPQFVAVLPLREGARNPAEYDGEEVAMKQHAAYPDIRTRVYVQSPAEVFKAAEQVARDMGWDVVDANQQAGRIEAVATTQWFGFKDDIVIRIVEGADHSSIFDIRSKSRIGSSDTGTNARRIRTFLAGLEPLLES